MLWLTHPARVKEHSFLLSLWMTHRDTPPCSRCQFPLEDYGVKVMSNKPWGTCFVVRALGGNIWPLLFVCCRAPTSPCWILLCVAQPGWCRVSPEARVRSPTDSSSCLYRPQRKRFLQRQRQWETNGENSTWTQNSLWPFWYAQKDLSVMENEVKWYGSIFFSFFSKESVIKTWQKLRTVSHNCVRD